MPHADNRPGRKASVLVPANAVLARELCRGGPGYRAATERTLAEGVVHLSRQHYLARVPSQVWCVSMICTASSLTLGTIASTTAGSLVTLSPTAVSRTVPRGPRPARSIRADWIAETKAFVDATTLPTTTNYRRSHRLLVSATRPASRARLAALAPRASGATASSRASSASSARLRRNDQPDLNA